MMFSTCKFSEGWQGGASFDFDGNFVGMNLVLDMERPIILPRSTILERWEHLRTSPQRLVFFDEKVKAVTFRNKGRTKGVKLYSRPQVYQASRWHPWLRQITAAQPILCSWNGQGNGDGG
ncbi:uncharacterized protein [Miscanthus floridulus]|uniref:uncharacterized protein n=1 Tax=Miscanthus floridulus TaxID=154761 RepID=UPI00345A12B4